MLVNTAISLIGSHLPYPVYDQLLVILVVVFKHLQQSPSVPVKAKIGMLHPLCGQWTQSVKDRIIVFPDILTDFLYLTVYMA
ncbi:unknown [Eggerthella sp. CAG:1427]|nr:unknown [Eggerthella sp. CAG:1427]